MLIILFGLSGSGKNFIGEIFKEQFDFFYWDADSELSEKMQTYIKNKKMFTQEMRDDFTKCIITRMKALSCYPNLVISQALYKEKNRLQIKKEFPHAIFVHIQASIPNIKARIIKRNNAVDAGYTNFIMHNFEPPKLTHYSLANDEDKTAAIKKISFLLSSR